MRIMEFPSYQNENTNLHLSTPRGVDELATVHLLRCMGC